MASSARPWQATSGAGSFGGHLCLDGMRRLAKFETADAACGTLQAMGEVTPLIGRSVKHALHEKTGLIGEKLQNLGLQISVMHRLPGKMVEIENGGGHEKIILWHCSFPHRR